MFGVIWFIIVYADAALCIAVVLTALRNSFPMRRNLHQLANELDCPRTLVMPSISRREQEIAKRIAISSLFFRDLL